jgi:hypothetical protein
MASNSPDIMEEFIGRQEFADGFLKFVRSQREECIECVEAGQALLFPSLLFFFSPCLFPSLLFCKQGFPLLLPLILEPTPLSLLLIICQVSLLLLIGYPILLCTVILFPCLL